MEEELTEACNVYKEQLQQMDAVLANDPKNEEAIQVCSLFVMKWHTIIRLSGHARCLGVHAQLH
jgi:hypothetical protein